MTSKNIYGTSSLFRGENDKFYFTYRISDLKTKMHYYGYKISLKSPYIVLGTTYF
jgi:hypothetical protein